MGDSSKSPTHQGGNILRLAVFGTIIACGVTALVYLDFSPQEFNKLVEQTPPSVFFLAMALLPVIGFPISWFYIYAGMAYPWLTAVGICWGALAINMSLSYWFAMGLLANPIHSLMARKQYKIPEISPHNQMRLTFLVRTIPGAPFPIQNYMLAVAGVPFKIYFPVSLIAQGVIACCVTFLSSQFAEHIDRKGFIITVTVILIIVAVKVLPKLQVALSLDTP
jgi:uncharacterized membrane protein YdjX (TVP38/TMEM64 family)